MMLKEKGNKRKAVKKQDVCTGLQASRTCVVYITQDKEMLLSLPRL